MNQYYPIVEFNKPIEPRKRDKCCDLRSLLSFPGSNLIIPYAWMELLAIISSFPWFGLRGILVNSCTVDAGGALVKIISLR